MTTVADRENQGDEQAKGRAPLPEAFTERQWLPGKSGNPAGRPKLQHTLTACLRSKLAETDPKYKRTYEQLLAEAIVVGGIKAAAKGNDGLAKFIFERVEGKMPDIIDLQAIQVMIAKPIEDMSLDELDAFDNQLQQLIKRFAPMGLPKLQLTEGNDTGSPGAPG